MKHICKNCGKEFEGRSNAFCCSTKCGKNFWNTTHRSERNKEKAKYRKSHVEEIKERHRKYYESHVEERREYNNAYSKSHAKKISDRGKRYAQKNAEKISAYRKSNAVRIREYNKKYDKENAEKRQLWNKVSWQKREAKKRTLPRTLTSSQWKAILSHFDNKCAYCGEPLTKAEQEHFIPLSKGGGYTKNNIVPACAKCNLSKSNKNPLDWLVTQAHGFISYLRITQYLENNV